MSSIENKWMVRCTTCGKEFNLKTASWCEHEPTKTKLCPSGHCICHIVHQYSKFREATEEEKKYGFDFMLKQEYGGVVEK